LTEDSQGLKVEINPADTSYTRDLMTSIRRGDVDQMSFQFETSVDEWDTTDQANVVRTLVEIKRLWDISPVSFPAYPQTSASVRKHLDKLQENKSSELTDKKDTDWQERISIRRKKLSTIEREN
jgi:HK97 family phage prohead protease